MPQLRITPLNRPVDTRDRWKDITPEMRAEYEAYQKQQAALREQFEREWVPPPGYSEEREREEMSNIDSAAFDVWEQRRAGHTAAASTPVYVDAFDYWLIDGPHMENDGILARQPTAVALTLPIVLKGGGDMQVTFATEKYLDKHDDQKPHTRLEREHRLIARTEHGVFSGHLIDECSERVWYVVSLPLSAPQVVADRIAGTLDAIQQLKLADDYLAIMPVSDRCSICSRPLTDLISKTLGIGPDCAASLGVRHSAAVADAIISRRRAFLAEEVAS